MPTSRPPAGFIAPMLPTLVDAAPDGVEWMHEIKFDGYRTELVIHDRSIRAFTRNGRDWTAKYHPLVDAARALACRSAIVDGEMCVTDRNGIADFRALRRSIQSAPDRLVLFAFDLLALDGRDLRREPLRDRRRRLADLLGREPAGPIQFSPDHVGEGPAFFRAADGHGLEGVVSKRADSPYASGRTTAWLKIKSFTVADYAVLGVERSRTGLPVALLASMERSPAYVGDAVVSLPAGERDAFWRSVEKLGTPRSRLAGALARRKAAWLKEGLVARVRHLRGEDKLRHATIQSIGPGGQGAATRSPHRHPCDE